MDDSLSRAAEVLNELTPGSVLEVADGLREGSLVLAANRVVDAARVLKTDDRLRFVVPLYCTALDWLEREPRFDVVWQVRSLHLGSTLRFKVRVADTLESAPRVPSLAGVWRGMGWHERETYDMFGIEFEGHPDLRRLLMPDDWEGHPLRKDYVSFGEPVKFTDRAAFQPDAAVPSGAPD